MTVCHLCENSLIITRLQHVFLFFERLYNFCYLSLDIRKIGKFCSLHITDITLLEEKCEAYAIWWIKLFVQFYFKS